MKDEDKIYGFVAQAEEIQGHAVKLQRTAEAVLQSLPGVVRDAIEEVVREEITESTRKAAERLLEASKDAKSASGALRRTGLLQGIFLLSVAVILVCVGSLALKYMTKMHMDELTDIRQQIATEQDTLTEIQAKTWSLELFTYKDGTRGIILPKGIKFERSGTIPDGRTAVVIKP